MIVAAFALFLLMLVVWMIAPDAGKRHAPAIDHVPTTEPTMIAALS